MRSVPDQEEQLREVIAHLGTALVQSDPTDDPIIIEHLRSAYDRARDILYANRVSTSRPAPSIVPSHQDENVYIVEDCLGSLGCVWREADIERTDLETVLKDLMAGEYRDPRRVIAFNTTEHWSEDVSADIAREIQRRSDLAFEDVPSSLQAFIDRHSQPDRQLALRLVR